MVLERPKGQHHNQKLGRLLVRGARSFERLSGLDGRAAVRLYECTRYNVSVSVSICAGSEKA